MWKFELFDWKLDFATLSSKFYINYIRLHCNSLMPSIIIQAKLVTVSVTIFFSICFDLAMLLINQIDSAFSLIIHREIFTQFQQFVQFLLNFSNFYSNCIIIYLNYTLTFFFSIKYIFYRDFFSNNRRTTAQCCTLSISHFYSIMINNFFLTILLIICHNQYNSWRIRNNSRVASEVCCVLLFCR